MTKRFTLSDNPAWAIEAGGGFHSVTSSPTYLAWVAEGNEPDPYAPSPSEVQASFTAAIQARLDAFARTRNYDGILSACSYVSSGVPAFAAEAAYCVAARDATWATGYEILAAVTGGQRAMPTVEQVMAELPALEWPL